MSNLSKRMRRKLRERERSRHRRRPSRRQVSPEETEALNNMWEVLAIKDSLRTRLQVLAKGAQVSPELDKDTGEWVLLVRGCTCPVETFGGYRVVNIRSRTVSGG